MDLAFWGLRDHPFRINVLPHAAYPLPGQVAARQQILAAFEQGERVAVLHGPHGVGKSVISQQIVHACETEEMTSAWAACVPHTGSQALFQMLLADLGLPFILRTPVELRLQFIEHLLRSAQSNKRFVLVNDEAHHLAAETLEHLRPLVELVTANGRPVTHLLLVGTSDLLQVLEQPEVAGLSAWVGCKLPLDPLDVETALTFLQMQWNRAGGHAQKQATTEAWRMLAELGKGTPLLMHRLARSAFQLAKISDQDTLDAEAVWEAAHELRLTPEAAPDEETHSAIPLRTDLKESA